MSLPIVPDDHLPASALLPVNPAYGTGSLADVLPSVNALLGVPGTTDVLGLRSRLDGVERVGVLLVDGLGFHQLPVAAAYAPTLADMSADAGFLTASFPSTTPVSLATLGTGVPPGAHGILGFTVRQPDGHNLTHIHWGKEPDPREWQPLPTRFEQAAAAGVRTAAVTKPEFEGTGLTVAMNRGAPIIPASTGEQVAKGLVEALTAGPSPALVYAYHPDLDSAGHGHGVDSPQWRAAAAGVDTLLDRVVHSLPPRSALLVIADHGQLNVPATSRIDMGLMPELSSGVIGVAGEPRVRYLYVASGARDDVIAAWRTVFGDQAAVVSREQAIDEGFYGPVPASHVGRIGEVVVICRERTVSLASGWEPPSVNTLVAYHGALTAAEMQIPLLIAR
ncbi:nucleotide pyrophosphatase/phosphodiesterase family protein [Actinoplanes sp. NPDC051411]|uniref:alkaline phosphatase family protein n=1 Tax=Actinoplanes sp. NPDC051411 TaxID=3155522 RepID=UPI00342FEEEF